MKIKIIKYKITTAKTKKYFYKSKLLKKKFFIFWITKEIEYSVFPFTQKTIDWQTKYNIPDNKVIFY